MTFVGMDFDVLSRNYGWFKGNYPSYAQLWWLELLVSHPSAEPKRCGSSSRQEYHSGRVPNSYVILAVSQQPVDETSR